MKFNSSQIEAINHNKGPALVLAGPGSGKTAVVTERIHRLVSEQKVNPSNILVITFTKAAAIEMKERFLRREGKDGTTVYFGTFHSVFFTILKHAYHYSATDIITESEQYEIMRKIIYQMQIECEDEKEMAGNLLAEISRVKGGLMDIQHYYSSNCGNEIFQKIYQIYEENLHGKRKIDFDDMLVFCYELFNQRKDILSAWQNKFQYILIDEFQDINAAQYSVVKMLSAPQNNIFVVGDDDQSIYGFRGANPEIMLNFEKDYPGCKKVLLDVNYRSQANIVKGAIKVINHNKKRFPKDIKAFREASGQIELCTYPELYDENSAVVEMIRKANEEGVPYEDIAILTRVNVGARLIAERLNEYNIPFRAKDVIPNIYEHWIARNMFSYIRIAMGNRDRMEFLNILNRPKRFISRDMLDSPKVDFEELRKNYFDKTWMIDRVDQFEEDIRMLSELNPFGAMNYIRRVIGYDEYLREYARDHGIKEDDLFEIINELQESAREFNTYAEWFSHIERYKQELKENILQEENHGVNIMTMHGAKGLEFRYVIILDANEGISPYKKAILDNELEEERRMFYVAMTRAKERLVICNVRTRYNKKADISRFVKELLS